MNKKGFTLIELLAVIVILAIIALISTPIILGIIEKSKKGAALSSANGYTDAIYTYQAMSLINGTDTLIEGIYNVNKTTTVSEKEYPKLNDIIKVKGSKPTTGTISINNSGSVGGLKLCINGYVIQYTNGENTIISDDCDEMDLTADYIISSKEWEKEKELTISYPTTSYKMYYEVESGDVYLEDTKIENRKEIEVTGNVTLKLKDNSRIKTWLLKGTKKVAVSFYEENKIDNVEIPNPVITLGAAAPTITVDGIVSTTSLKISYDNIDDVTPYYSENGKDWKEYTNEIQVQSFTIKAKLVRNKSKMESEIVEQIAAVSTDYLSVQAYDGNKTTKTGDLTKTKYINVDSSMYGKQINITGRITLGLTIIKKDGTEERLGGFGGNASPGEKVITIPTDTVKLKFPPYQAGQQASDVYEISVYNQPTTQNEFYYPLIKTTGIDLPYNMVTINYFVTSIKKLYRINDGEWKIYENKPIRVEIGDILEAKGINSNNVETEVTRYVSELLVDSLTSEAYDGNKTTKTGDLTKTKYINVDSSMYGKQINITGRITLGLTIIKKDGTEERLGGFGGNASPGEKVITIPTDTVKLKFPPYQAGQQASDVYEISVVN